MISIFLLLCAATSTHAGQLDAILKGLFDTEIYKVKSPGAIHWLDSGAAYAVYEEKEIVRYDTATGKREVLVTAAQLTPPSATKPLAIDSFAFTKDAKQILLFANTRKVWRQNTRGDYWIFHRASQKLRKLGGNSAKESTLMFAKFSPDGRHVAYVRDNNLYVEETAGAAIRQLTKDGSETIINGTSDWVYEEELDVRDAFRWSPDSQSIAFWHFDSSAVGKFPLVNNTATDYPAIQWIRYPKSGTANSAVRVGVMGIRGGRTTWIKVPGDPSASYIARMDWTEGAPQLAIQHLNRAQNTIDLLLANPRSGAVTPAFRDEDKAWLDVNDDPTWLSQGARFTWISERDGWRRLYLVSRDGKQIDAVSPPNADVIRLIAANDTAAYYIASPDNATQRYLYRVNLDTKAAQRITPASQPGTHSYNIDPSAKFAIHTYSAFDRPPVTDLVRLPDHQSIRTLEANPKLNETVTPLLTQPTEFFQVDIGEGVTLDGWMIKPPSFDPAKKYPLLLYVYGEPFSTTVTDQWDPTRALFHRGLATEGYIVATVDNRSTAAPKGRVWRKAIHGAIGVLSAKELTAATRTLLAQRAYLDPQRVAVWGWSGGGSNTLNLMFRSPDLFQLGMSVAPVPDQRLYDTIYQERYMGTPQSNPKGYETGSPINFAQNLKGRLLLVHGTGDDNVHYQGTERLINRLIELGKPFDMMAYPNRSHSISEGKGTSLHLYQFLGRYLMQHLPPTGVR